MLHSSQLSKDLTNLTHTMQIISKIDNKLGKSLALDRASYKFQQIKNKVFQEINCISKNLENRKSKSKLTPLNKLQFDLQRKRQQQDFVSEYLQNQHKRDQRFQKYQHPFFKTTQTQFRKTKFGKTKSKPLYTFYGCSNAKQKHNKIGAKELNQQSYKQGMYILTNNNYRKEEIDMSFIQNVMPRPIKNPIARRNLDTIFTVKNENVIEGCQEFQLQTSRKDVPNLFLNHSIDENFSQLNVSQIRDKKLNLMGQSQNIKFRIHQGPSLDILNFKIDTNEVYKLFRQENIHIWPGICTIIYKIQNFMKLCGLSSARVKTKQLIKLESSPRKINNQLLMSCLNNSESIKHLLHKHKKQTKIDPESAAVFIQDYWRYHLQLKKLNSVFRC